MIKHLPLCLAGFAVLALSACSTQPYKPRSSAAPQIVASPDNVSAMLAEAADRASTALETLAAVEYHKSPGVAVAPIANAPIELRRAVSVNWVGPAAPITENLAARASYGFVTIGTPPPVPVIISLDIENKPVIEVLRDIGLQLGMRGDIRVDGVRRIIELHYAANTGVGSDVQP